MKRHNKHLDLLNERKAIELRECTFHPNTTRVTPARVRNRSKNGSIVLHDSLVKSPTGNGHLRSKRSVRSPEHFYMDMIAFKNKKEAKLERSRNLSLNEIK